MRKIRSINVAVVLLVLGTLPLVSASASSAESAVPRCATSSLSVKEYNTLVGAGHVNILFWIRNVGGEACAISGFPSVRYESYHGVLLPVREGHFRGNGGNFVGGVARGRVLPSTTLAVGRGIASFWIDGLDIPAGNPEPSCIDTTRMLFAAPDSSDFVALHTAKGRGFFWCGGVDVLPVIGNNSGSLPARPLSFFFGVPG